MGTQIIHFYYRSGLVCAVGGENYKPTTSFQSKGDIILQSNAYYVPYKVIYTGLITGFAKIEMGILEVDREFSYLNESLYIHHNNKKEIVEPNHITSIFSLNAANQIRLLLNGVQAQKAEFKTS